MLKRAVLSLSMLLVACAASLSAQLITIRTVPVSQAHQFDIYPSRTLAMGGVSIAVDDPLLDPFANPATGARLVTGHFFGSPSVYSVSSGAGGGRTLPVGAMTRVGAWFGGFSLALQEVDLSQFTGFQVFPQSCPACGAEGVDLGPVDRSHGNTHVFATLGRDLPAAGLSLAGSVYWSRLNAIDGVDLLYANSARIKQYGHAVDLRVGILKEWEDTRSLKAVALHNRFGMTHDVFYLDSFWEPVKQQFSQRPRMDRNLDRTTVWGLHTEYEWPLTETGWRLGGLVTGNLMSHPKIPNYEIQNIPRDPGNSSAFNVGVGISRIHEALTFGVDLIYEPIWSHTWADSEQPVQTALGDTISPGGMTIENHFRFSNALFRMGFDQGLELGDDGTMAQLQFGLAVRNIHYWLDQTDHVQLSSRSLEEQWAEWTPTWGLGFRFPALEVRYRGSVTSGTGRPGVFSGTIAEGDIAVAAPASNLLVAPSGPLTMTEVRVITHQISISLPLR